MEMKNETKPYRSRAKSKSNPNLKAGKAIFKLSSRLDFGVHLGKTIDRLIVEEPDYLTWMHRQFFDFHKEVVKKFKEVVGRDISSQKTRVLVPLSEYLRREEAKKEFELKEKEYLQTNIMEQKLLPINAKSIEQAHFDVLINDIKIVSTAGLLAGEATAVTLKSVQGLFEEFNEFVKNSGISKSNKYIMMGLVHHFLLEKAQKDGVIFITATQKQNENIGDILV